MNQISPASLTARVADVLPAADRHHPGLTLRLAVAAIVLIFAAGLVWAANSRIAIMASANGRVVPPQRVQSLGHAEGGAVAALHVRIGQRVNAGDPLIDLDATGARADLAQQVFEGQSLMGDIRRLDAESRGLEPDFTGLASTMAAQQAALFRTRQHRHREELLVVQGEINAYGATVGGISAALAPLQQRMLARRGLAEKGLASRFQVNEDEARVAELIGRLQEGRANEEKARRRLVTVDGAWQEDIAKSLKEAHAKLDSLSSLRPKLERRLQAMHITAPVGGVVKTVSVTGVGATLRPGEAVVEIVPDDSKRMISVKLPAAEVGHVRLGQKARITLIPPDSHLRPLSGSVTQIAPDSSADEHSGQFNYIVEISPDALEFQGEQGEIYPLSPGVPVAVTIITGMRSVLGAVAGPLFAELERAANER
jgi:adhesin transport system membrane fusion protein